MKARKLFPILLGVAILTAGSSLGRAQQSEYQRKIEEYNAYVDTTRAQDATERLKLIEAFLQNYPQSQYRAFVYPAYVQTAWQLKRYATVMKAVDQLLTIDRGEVTQAYKQSNPDISELQIDNTYYQGLLLYTYSFLQSFRNATPEADRVAAKAAERARQGLELHEKLYRQVQPSADATQRKQFEQQKRDQEAAFHSVLALAAWRGKDYASAAREYSALVDYTPDNAVYNYQLGQSYLRSVLTIGMAKRQVRGQWGEPKEVRQTRMQPGATELWCYGDACERVAYFDNDKLTLVQYDWKLSDTERQRLGFWHVARAVALNIPKSHEVKDYLLKNVAAYQTVLPGCSVRQVDKLIAQASQSTQPPSEWQLASAKQIAVLRQDLSVKRIFDDLQAGGEQEELIWLASCGMEFPELNGKVIEVSESTDNLVTLRVAATQEAAEANIANVEVKVIEPPEANNLQSGDFIRFSGVFSDYENAPQFLVKLTGGKVNPEDIPKTRR